MSEKERNWSENWKVFERERIKEIFPNEDLVKREDLQRWKEIFDLPYAEFTHPDGRFESDYIKEEYKIE